MKSQIKAVISKAMFISLLGGFCFNAQSFNGGLEIVNGKPVALGENYALHTVGVGSSELMCTGVLIAKNFVLTAGHCKDDVVDGRIFFGTNKTNFIYRQVVQVTEHPDYCKNHCGTLDSEDDYDIAIVEFEGDIPEGFSTVPIAPKTALTPHLAIHLAGFGANESHRYEDILKVTQVPFDSFVGHSEFKTNETTSGSCNGDSGGPAFIMVEEKLQLAGLTSRGDPACRRLGIYTMVHSFEEWIKGFTEKTASVH